MLVVTRFSLSVWNLLPSWTDAACSCYSCCSRPAYFDVFSEHISGKFSGSYLYELRWIFGFSFGIPRCRGMLLSLHSAALVAPSGLSTRDHLSKITHMEGNDCTSWFSPEAIFFRSVSLKSFRHGWHTRQQSSV